MKKKLIVPLVALSLGLTATPAMARDGMADLATASGGGWTYLIALLLPAVQKVR